MQWLTALLAFATTMLIMAIVVSTLVETIHRIWKFRSKGMRLMLENLYMRVIAPKLDKDTRPSAAEFASIIMENRAATPTDGALARGRLSRIIRWLVDAWVMTDIPVEVFTQKLADNRIVGAVDAFTDEFVQDLAIHYEAFGKEVTTFFERRARLISVFVAIVVAWGFHIHPYHLALSYLENPELAEAMADRSEEAYANYQDLEAKMDAFEATLAGVENTSAEDLQEAFDAFRTNVTEIGRESEELKGMGVPIGWGEVAAYEACAGIPFVTGCRASWFGWQFPLPSFADAIWLSLGGLLIGLGAPFWAQAVSSLTATRDLSRKISEIVAPGATPAPSEVPAEGVPSPEPLAVKTFKMASGRAFQA